MLLVTRACTAGIVHDTQQRWYGMPVCAKDLRCVQAHPFRPRLLATSTETRCRQAAPSSPWCTISPPTGEHAQMVTDQTKNLLALGSQMPEPVADRRTGRPQG